MASTENPADDLTRKTRHDKLEAIIRHRLGLSEDWFAITNRPSFFSKMTKSRLATFEDAFGELIKLGCKWEILLTCLTCYHTYNARRPVLRPARYDSDGELSNLPEKEWEPAAAARPPDRDTRNRIATNLNAAAGEIETHEDLLSTLGCLDPPPQTVWPDPALEGEMRDVRITADEAVIYVQRLLKWCRRLLAEGSIGNFKTVESVGQLVPCVYVEWVAPKARPSSRQCLPLEPVAELLKAMSSDSCYKQDQLREALNRFRRAHPKAHRELRAKIADLHRTSNEPADGWRRLFAAEDRFRSR